ncbi:2-oxoglutarate dehydrogenase E1 component [Paraliobacillus zengyii]|uniref:2-oxoglutarate dehydrogenase E1 component n=1 Tax=Paraliobacillus zengyii TaxID=2213194 RepID=UPI000DD3FFFC
MEGFHVTKRESKERFWRNIHAANRSYIEEQYRMFLQNATSVPTSFRDMFEQYGAPNWADQSINEENRNDISFDMIKKVTATIQLVEAIRRYGHLAAKIYPVGRKKNRHSTLILPVSYGLTEEDLMAIPATLIWETPQLGLETAHDIIEMLKSCYSNTISFEYDHVNQHEERKWLQDQIELGDYRVPFSESKKKNLLTNLIEVEGFEKFLGKTFVAQKRFSIEGLDVMVPMLNLLVQQSLYDETENVMIGMAHRGRLSVLTHILGKPFDLLFSEFHHAQNKALLPISNTHSITYGWTGDVKYHFGAKRDIGKEKPSPTRITLAHNPSHLEFVNPVVEGFTRACQDYRFQSGYPKQDQDKAFSILIHGDAAFIGQGVVAETLNLSALPGYQTGGTIHLIANNQIGFTTNHEQSRSTRYASDLAKGFEIPIVHVNADDPEACLSAMKLACAYRKKFHKDFLIDLVGYRRYGHNEMDEPRATQPALYQEIDQHPTVTALYANKLIKESIIDAGAFHSIQQKVWNDLQEIYENMKENNNDTYEPKAAPTALAYGLEQFNTAVPFQLLDQLNSKLLNRPEGFTTFQKLETILKKRARAFDENQTVDWASAEVLAYASILTDGIPIRLTGQDTERGTFAHRHLMLHDVHTGDRYCPLHGLGNSTASFSIHNSPLSEVAVLGFEYGYSVEAPKTLVIWEAQFGDFANVGQVMFDQFISSGRAKWGEKSNMVFLLPHGYEGQGPEHSSARLERFLSSAAENNWIIANVTTSAQYFHLLRRQAALVDSDAARPLIVMTPKSLLRHAAVVSHIDLLSEGRFETCMSTSKVDGDYSSVKRIIIGSGKVMIDLNEALIKLDNTDWVHVIRLEQIYPFPKSEIDYIFAACEGLEEVIWIQEEPENMGAWNFVKDRLYRLLPETVRLRFVGRWERSAPAVGDLSIHKNEQKHIIETALEDRTSAFQKPAYFVK